MRSHGVPPDDARARMYARRPRRPRPSAQAGLSLVETVALISLSGVLLAVFVPNFVRHLHFSKVAEASQRLDDLYRASAAYYATERQLAGRPTRGCLPESAGPTPSAPSRDPQPVDFLAPDVADRETWRVLGLSEATLRYSYQIVVEQPGCAPRSAPAYPALLLRAHGDLDGDGAHSVLERSASISSDQRALLPIVPLRITKRTE
jgi:type II secretory pathway pseudopilin PulG